MYQNPCYSINKKKNNSFCLWEKKLLTQQNFLSAIIIKIEQHNWFCKNELPSEVQSGAFFYHEKYWTLKMNIHFKFIYFWYFIKRIKPAVAIKCANAKKNNVSQVPDDKSFNDFSNIQFQQIMQQLHSSNSRSSMN